MNITVYLDRSAADRSADADPPRILARGQFSGQHHHHRPQPAGRRHDAGDFGCGGGRRQVIPAVVRTKTGPIRRSWKAHCEWAPDSLGGRHHTPYLRANMTDTFPDRLSVDPDSPHYNEESAVARHRHPFRGEGKDQCRGILHQRGLDPRGRRRCQGPVSASR